MPRSFSLTGSIRGLNSCGKVFPKHSRFIICSCG